MDEQQLWSCACPELGQAFAWLYTLEGHGHLSASESALAAAAKQCHQKFLGADYGHLENCFISGR